MQDTKTRLQSVVVDVLNLDIPSDAIDEETNLYELGLESLNVQNLLTEIESSFDLAIDVEDLSAELFLRFGNLASLVEGKAGA